MPPRGTLIRMVTAAPRRGGSSVTMRRAVRVRAASRPMGTGWAGDRAAPVPIAAEYEARGWAEHVGQGNITAPGAVR